MFKQLLQAEAIASARSTPAASAASTRSSRCCCMAAKFGVPVCPHAGGVGLCEFVQHLSIIDYVARQRLARGRMIEYVDHLHEHFLDPVVIRDAALLVPTLPGYSAEMRPDSLARYRFPDGDEWRAIGPSSRPRHAAAAAGAVGECGGSDSASDVRPDRIDEYERLHAAAVAGRPRADPALEHPELHDLPRRDRPVRILRVHRRRLRGRHGGDGRRSRDPALVGAHRRHAGAAPRPRARQLVEDDRRGLPHGLPGSTGPGKLPVGRTGEAEPGVASTTPDRVATERWE